MNAPGARWRLRLTATAEADYREILHWTRSQFGDRQARIYARTLALALEALSAGPEVVGAKRRDEIARGIRFLHVARAGRRGRHFIVFRVSGKASDRVIDVLRLLHDAMDLPRHVLASEDSD